MLKRVMNVLTIISAVIAFLLSIIDSGSIKTFGIVLIILLAVVTAMNYIFFSQITIWHRKT
jgi:hypothetical protein